MTRCGLDFLASVTFAVLSCCSFVFFGVKTSCLTVLLLTRSPISSRLVRVISVASRALAAPDHKGSRNRRNSGSCPPRTSSRRCRRFGSRDLGAEPARAATCRPLLFFSGASGCRWGRDRACMLGCLCEVFKGFPAPFQ